MEILNEYLKFNNNKTLSKAMSMENLIDRNLKNRIFF